ncbi:hypothetical protein G6O69_25555 [Pseudenhygromyxa sp. WMMC2535]|uniref:hypothetical protein n=1 Tax=Pseudenhygromyxa sp. WMMC2535 TaxID=2712867 RepID=UPI00155696C0|nr:hypothetical protein [Pseudenhygromyxa sp. WMMC2535]NVB41231.1 hypothetical protein [Pseudenhygromyxa sp. WMMC2535]
MRTNLTRHLGALGLLAALLSGAATAGCAGSSAYVDWRPGLTSNDFDGLFELSRGEYEDFAERAMPNTVVDRAHGESRSDAGERMAALGERVANSVSADPHGYPLVGLDGEGHVALLAGDRRVEGEVDWLAITSGGDTQAAAVLLGRRLAVVHGGASTGVDLGSLLGPGAAGYRFMLLLENGELTVFAMPEVGGAITAYEPGYVLTFVPRPGTKQGWEVSVARVSVTL